MNTKFDPSEAAAAANPLTATVKKLETSGNAVLVTSVSEDSSSRCYGIYEDFDVFLGARTGRVRIDGYDGTGFILNGVKHEGSLICLGKLIFKWTPKKPSEITPESLSIFELLRPAPELLILGHGTRIVRVRPEVRAFLKSKSILLEAIDTKNAASTFNFLNEEGRQVAVAMLPQGSTDD